mgnify:CR=1 FL=1
MKINIYVMEERWVIVGAVAERSACGTRTKLGKAAVVCIWGTTAGLGQLAREGPTSATTLHWEDGVEIHERYIMRVIPCNNKAWAKWIQEE